MKVTCQITLLIIIALFFSCKPKTAENLEEMARRSSRPEAVLVKTVRLEPSTFYHELVSNGKAYSSEKAVVPFKVSGIIKELTIRNGQKVKTGELHYHCVVFFLQTQNHGKPRRDGPPLLPSRSSAGKDS